MGGALVIVNKEAGGEQFSNTHALYTGDPAVIPSDANLTAWGAGSDLGDVATNGSLAAENPLQAIVTFERLMHYDDVNFLSIYVTDGKRNRILGLNQPNAYFTAALSGKGLVGGTEAAETVVPGNITWQINRNPTGFSARKGRLFLRLCIADSDVKFGGPKLLVWTATTSADGFRTRLSNGLVTSNLSSYFVGGANAATAIYGIPHYRTFAGPGTALGELETVIGCASMASVGPAARQVKRGRKRAA